MQVEVVYATKSEQYSLLTDVAEGMRLDAILQKLGLFERFPELRNPNQAFGIFGSRVGLDHRCQAGDRIECYRPLICDPKAARLARLAKKSQK